MEVKVPPRPTLPKRAPQTNLERERDEDVEARVRFVEEVAMKPQGEEADDEEEDNGTGSSGSVIMFAQMAKGALSMLDSFSTPPSSPLLPRARNDHEEGTDKEDEEDDDDNNKEETELQLDLRGVKTYMRDLTLRLSAVAQANAGGGSGEDGAAKVKRGNGGRGGRGGGGGTIRLYHAMNKGHRRLALPTAKNEDDERKSESDEDDGEGEGAGKGGDDWAAKRRQLGEAKKTDPVFVWKTLTPRQPPPSASIIDRSGLGSPLASPEYVALSCCALACACVPWLTPPVTRSSRVVRRKKQEMLRREFIDTEATYVQNLDTIIKVHSIPPHRPSAANRPPSRARCADLTALHKTTGVSQPTEGDGRRRAPRPDLCGACRPHIRPVRTDRSHPIAFTTSSLTHS
jgi:hypothetical protein